MDKTADGYGDVSEQRTKDSTCRRCGTVMQPGKAIEQTYRPGFEDFPGATDLRGITMSPGGSGRLVNAMKCPNCGHTVTA